MTKELDQRVLLGVSAREGLTPAKREEREMESMLKLGCLLLECGGRIKEGRSRASFDFAPLSLSPQPPRRTTFATRAGLGEKEAV